jgi:hypothetical protein
MDVLGREVSREVSELYEEILSRWPDRPISFASDGHQETEGRHERQNDGSTRIYLREDADDEVVFHELMHDLYLKRGASQLRTFLLAPLTPAALRLKNQIETTVSHIYLHDETLKRGYARDAYWRRLIEGVGQWSQPEAKSCVDRIKNASIVAEIILCSGLETSALQSRMASVYPLQTWPLTLEIIDALRLDGPRTFEGWRKRLASMLTIAEELLVAEGSLIPIKAILLVDAVYTAADLRKSAKRLLDIEVLQQAPLVRLINNRDGTTIWGMVCGSSQQAVREAPRVKSQLFQEMRIFLQSHGVRYQQERELY